MAECEKNEHIGFYKGGFVRPADLEFNDSCTAAGGSDEESSSPMDTIAVGRTFQEYNDNW